MNRPKIYVVPPEHIEKAWPEVEALDLIVPEPKGGVTKEQVLTSLRNSLDSGAEELHAIIDSGGNLVASYTTIETKDSGLLVRFIAGKDAPVWMGYILRNIHELANVRGLRYAKVISKAF